MVAKLFLLRHSSFAFHVLEAAGTKRAMGCSDSLVSDD